MKNTHAHNITCSVQNLTNEKGIVFYVYLFLFSSVDYVNYYNIYVCYTIVLLLLTHLSIKLKLLNGLCRSQELPCVQCCT